MAEAPRKDPDDRMPPVSASSSRTRSSSARSTGDNEDPTLDLNLERFLSMQSPSIETITSAPSLPLLQRERRLPTLPPRAGQARGHQVQEKRPATLQERAPSSGSGRGFATATLRQTASQRGSRLLNLESVAAAFAYADYLEKLEQAEAVLDASAAETAPAEAFAAVHLGPAARRRSEKAALTSGRSFGGSGNGGGHGNRSVAASTGRSASQPPPKGRLNPAGAGYRPPADSVPLPAMSGEVAAAAASAQRRSDAAARKRSVPPDKQQSAPVAGSSTAPTVKTAAAARAAAAAGPAAAVKPTTGNRTAGVTAAAAAAAAEGATAGAAAGSEAEYGEWKDNYATARSAATAGAAATRSSGNNRNDDGNRYHEEEDGGLDDTTLAARQLAEGAAVVALRRELAESEALLARSREALHLAATEWYASHGT
ncbi:unnamed protein product [Phaeothamnion confervicola]